MSTTPRPRARNGTDEDGAHRNRRALRGHLLTAVSKATISRITENVAVLTG
jgi:hypothetical protein